MHPEILDGAQESVLAALRGVALAEIHEGFRRNYAGIAYDPYHLARSLVCFVEAEAEPMPQMLEPVRWEDVRAFFLRESRPVFGE